jgi:ribosomal protein S27E
MTLSALKMTPVKSKRTDILNIPCAVCRVKRLIYANPKEVKCMNCLSVYSVEWLLKKKG